MHSEKPCKLSKFTNKIQNTSQNSRLVDASVQKIKTEEWASLLGSLQKNGQHCWGLLQQNAQHLWGVLSNRTISVKQIFEPEKNLCEFKMPSREKPLSTSY